MPKARQWCCPSTGETPRTTRVSGSRKPGCRFFPCSFLGTGEHALAERSLERSRGHGPKWHPSVACILQPEEHLLYVDR